MEMGFPSIIITYDEEQYNELDIENISFVCTLLCSKYQLNPNGKAKLLDARHLGSGADCLDLS